MLNTIDTVSILNGLVTQGSSTGTFGNVSNSINCYNAELALFTTMPGITGAGGVEVSLSGYARKKLTGYSIAGDTLFADTAAWDENEEKYKITNTAPIQMHSIDEFEENEEDVLGFGIYAAEDSGSNAEKRLVAWGSLVDENGDPVVSGQDGTAPTLSAGSVPIFYAGDFELLLGSENSGGLEPALCVGLLNTMVQMGATDSTGGAHTYTLQTYQPELALFTTLPDADGTGAVEVPTEIEVSGETVETGYTRKALWGMTPTSGVLQFANTARFESSSMKYAIKNSEEIQMSCIYPSINTSYTILGFGIYAASTSGGTKRLVAWGALVDSQGNPVVSGTTAPVLTGGSVPIFYANNFKLLLGGDASGATYVAVTEVTLDKSTHTFSSFTDTVQLTATVAPNNATDKSVSWESSNPSVATVNNFGKVVAGAIKGTATVTAVGNDSKYATCTITYNSARPTGFTLKCDKELGIKKSTGSIPLTTGDYIAKISLDTITPDTVAAGDQEIVFELPYNVLEYGTATSSYIQVWSKTSGSYTITAKLAKDNTITATIPLIVSN